MNENTQRVVAMQTIEAVKGQMGVLRLRIERLTPAQRVPEDANW